MDLEEAIIKAGNLIEVAKEYKKEDEYKKKCISVGQLIDRAMILETVLQELERLQKENENYNNAMKTYNLTLQGFDFKIDKISELYAKLEQLQEENEELKHQEVIRSVGKYNEIEINKLIEKTFKNNFINKDKVKEKIEELKQEDREY